ncbi:creatininase family protein [Haloplanus sp. GCM10025708]|uniref:creatininase family protein n=1 Tax=Haloferacaceae TaxID=1644056 RepID=UPI0036172254
MHLSNATWPELRDAETNLAVVPVGSTEQHGPHAPLGTDAVNAEAVAEAGVERADRDVVVAPTVSVGVSEEHRHFAGTLWVSPDTFRAYVRELVESLATHGFDRIVLVNGHGGNVDALREVSAAVSRSGEAFVVPFTWFDAVGDHRTDMGHAGPLETALLRAERPELVREGKIDEARDGASDRWGDWVGRVNLAYDSAEFTENGVVGDPDEGDAELGEELLDGAAESLSALLAAVADRERTERR